MDEQKGIMSEFAMASLLMGIVSFINIFGMEKAIMAIVFGVLALKKFNTIPQLQGKKLAVAGIILGAVSIIIIAIFTVKFLPQLQEMMQKMKSIQ